MTDATEVLSLDELMDLAGPSPAPPSRTDAAPPTARASGTGYTRAREWLSTGDNGVIAATALVALLLLLVVGTM